MPRVLTGVNAESRASISRAALLVKVTASTECGLAWPVASNQASRVVSTRVWPLPGPARISAEPCGKVTAASCSGLRLAKSGDDMQMEPTPGDYRRIRAAALSIAADLNRLRPRVGKNEDRR